MAAFALQPSTIDLITERMKRDGYSSPDVLVREALECLKPVPATTAGNDDLELDLSYESVPLKTAGFVTVAAIA